MEPKKRSKTLYEEVYEEIKNDILTGKLKKGERLVSKRNLAEQFGVSVVTAENAVAQLVAEGYITAVERSGYYIRYSGSGVVPTEAEKISEEIPEDNRVISGAASLFPFTVWARLMRTVILEQNTKLLMPVSGGGVYQLKAAISDYLYRCRGMRVRPGQIVIGAGSEYLYNLIIQFLGKERCYALENPCYEKTAKIYRLNDVKQKYIEMDKHGIIPDCLKKSKADVVHISPAHHFPSGAVMPISRRSEIMNWAGEKEGRYIIEDDYDSEFRRTGLPVPAMFSMDNTGSVIYINTFSQTIAPSVRISYMCLPESMLERWNEKMGFYACPVPAFEQYTLAKFISDGYFERHINRVKKHVYKSLEIITETLKSAGVKIHEAGDGLHFTVTVAEDGDFIHKAKQCGMEVRPLSSCYSQGGEAHKNDYIISYANADIQKITEVFKKESGDENK